MNLDLLDADLREHFTPDRRAALLDLTREAYDRAALRYSPDDGDDAQLNGFTVYKFVSKRFVDLCRDSTLGFELRSHHPMIRIGVGPFTLAAYCCGPSGDQLIGESFPLNENGAPQLVDLNQFCLELDFEQSVPRQLVLAHLGNPFNGLEALYLAVPGGKQEGRNRIGSWSYTDLLWKRDQIATPQTDLPRPVRIDPAPLTLKLPAARRNAPATD